jgi:hypothetical protein
LTAGRGPIIPLTSDFPRLWKNAVTDAVKPEITPEPSPEEREALEEALARLLEPRPEPRTPWWRRGIEESVAEEESA